MNVKTDFWCQTALKGSTVRLKHFSNVMEDTFLSATSGSIGFKCSCCDVFFRNSSQIFLLSLLKTLTIPLSRLFTNAKLSNYRKRACLYFFNVVQVQAYIISSLKKEMPSVFGKDSKKKELIANLGEIYQRIEKEHQISPGDFPNLAKMQVRSKNREDTA